MARILPNNTEITSGIFGSEIQVAIFLVSAFSVILCYHFYNIYDTDVNFMYKLRINNVHNLMK